MNIVLKKIIFIMFTVVLLISCEEEKKEVSYVYSFVLKNDRNPIYQAAYNGGKAAGLASQSIYNSNFIIDRKVLNDGIDPTDLTLLYGLNDLGSGGILSGYACSRFNSPALGFIAMDAKQKGTDFVYYIYDFPDTNKTLFYGVNDSLVGDLLVKLLSEELPDGGKIAILSGRRNSLNFSVRLKGIFSELDRYPLLTLAPESVYYCDETPENASEVINSIQLSNPDIDGWIIAYGDIFLMNDAIKWAVGEVKAVTVEGYPEQLDYLEAGYLNAIVASDYYNQGYQSIKAMIENDLEYKVPEKNLNYDSLQVIRKGDIPEWLMKWEKWLK